MAAVTNLSRETYDDFIRQHRFAAVLFDAPRWNFTYMRTVSNLLAAANELGGSAALGFLDIDGPAEEKIVRSIPVGGVPFVAYYRSGQLVAGLVGNGQDVVARMRTVISGQPIGYGDGHQP